MHYTQIIHYLLIAFAFSFPISIGAANILLALMLIMWILEGKFQKKWEILKKEKIIWIFFSIAFLTLLSAFFSHSLTDSFLARPGKILYKVIASHFIWLPILLVIFITSIKKIYLDKIITAFLSAIFISEIISYLIYFQLIDIEYFKSLHLLYQSASYQDPTPFMHHTAYSVFLNISILLLIHKLIHTKGSALKLFLFLFLTSAIVNLFMNGGRTGQLGFTLSILVYFAFYMRFTFKSFLLTIVLLSSILFTAYKVSPIFHKRVHLAIDNLSNASKGDYNSSWGVRVASNIVAISYLFDSPSHFIFGAGAGDAKKEYLAYANEHFEENISSVIPNLHHLHNQYLQYWFDGTILSLILFLYYFYLLFRLPIESKYKPLLFAVTVSIMFSVVGDILFFRYKPFFLFLLMAGYFIVLSKKNAKVHNETFQSN